MRTFRGWTRILLVVITISLLGAAWAAASPSRRSDLLTPPGAPTLSAPELLGQLGGASNAVAVDANIAYLGVGPRLAVLNVANPANPDLLGETPPLPGTVSEVVVLGSLAYVAAEEGGLRIVETSVPGAPTEIGHYDTPGYARGVAVAGGFAYVAQVGTYSSGIDGLHIVDVTQPTAPFQTAFLAAPGETSEVVQAAGIAYLAGGAAGLLIVDVSDPYAPANISALDTPGYARGVELAGFYIYVADGYGGLRVVDVSVPQSPVEMGSIDTGAFARGVAVAGQLAYVADGYGGLRVIDVSEPSDPVEVGAYDPSEYLSAVAVAGTYAYAADGYGGLRTVDVSAPENPAEVGIYDAPGIARDIAVLGQFAYIADNGSGLRIVDISTPASLSAVGFAATSGGARGVAVASDVDGTYAYLADGSKGLCILDVSSPDAPLEIGSVDTPGNATGVWLAVPYAYIADGDRGLRIVDVSDPALPFEVGAFDTPGDARRVVVADDLAYIADANAGLRVVDVSTPSSPVEVGSVQTFRSAYDLAVEGSYAYIATGGGGMAGSLDIVDVSQPSQPVRMGLFRATTKMRAVALAGSTAYVADWQGGLTQLDVSNPAAPVEIEFADMPGDAWTVALVGAPGELDIFLANGESGLVVMRQGVVGHEPVEVSLADADLTFLGEEAGDWAAYAVAPAGDVNDDGFADILIGAPLAGEKNSAPIPKGAGKAYLILGRPLSDWPEDHINLTQADASFLGCVVTSMTGRQNYAAGDVNGDGYDDFLITGWKCGGPDRPGKGYLYLGRPNVDWGIDYPVDGADAGFLGENTKDEASYYVSTAGDVNGDGYDDFLFTSPQNSEAGDKAGQIYLILGRPDADWGANYPLAQADASFLGEAVDDRAGRSAASAGDVNGDGYDDFLIGALFSDDGAQDAGEAYLFLGRAAADWGMDFSLAQADASFVGEAAGDEIGRRVAGAGDVNGDGYDDFLLGASRHDANGADAGKAYLFLGRAAADWGPDTSVAVADASFLGEEEGDQAGRRVSDAGDVNDDGYADFLISGHHNGRSGPGAGTGYLFYGRPNVDWGSNYPLAQADVLYLGEAPGDAASYDVAPAGDMDGDGVDDFLVGAWHGSENGDLAGQGYVLVSNSWPRPIRFDPGSPHGYVGQWQDFSGEYSDSSGWEDIASASMAIGRHPEDRRGFIVKYEVAENAFYLRTSDGFNWLGPCSPGQNVKLYNNIVQLDCKLSTVNHDGGLVLEVTWRGRWLRPITNPRVMTAYLRAIDQAGHDSGYVELGSWTLIPAAQ